MKIIVITLTLNHECLDRIARLSLRKFESKSRWRHYKDLHKKTKVRRDSNRWILRYK